MKILYFVFLSFLSLGLQAQLVNKGDLKIMPGTTLYVSGIDVTNDNGTNHIWSNDGNFIFKGDNFTNNGTMDADGTGTTEFSGANLQHILGSEIAYFHNLNISNANNSVFQEAFVDADNLTVNDGAADFDYRVFTDYSLTVNDNVTLNGDLRLSGTSQLLQTHAGTTANTGDKYIWIDQQGTTNQYWYNYWSAPVNQNGVWKVRMLRDGAQGDDVDQSKYPLINIVDNRNATSDLPAQSHPVYLNAYWMWSFPNGPDGSYTGWVHIKQNGALNPGEGYTMKGPGVDANLNSANGSNTTEYDSWTFAGLPNDGDYSLHIDPAHDYLIGNPYPSALDADQFIKDNISSANGGNNTDDIFNGTLYYWEHTGGNDHFGANYQGGYATYTLSGGVAATSWTGSGNTVGTKTPERYIPVGQGFTVWAEDSNDGGEILFNNAQRKFKKEADSSVFIRPVTLTDIRLGLNTPLDYHRQLLLAARPNTTDGIDTGWDGPNFDGDYPGADMYWIINNRDFIIQAVPQITEYSGFPLKVVMATDDVVTFNIDSADNLPSDISRFYIHDTYMGTYNEISTTDYYEIFLKAGTYDSRFELVFKDPTVLSDNLLSLNHISSYFDANTQEIVILNNKEQAIDYIALYALTGQEIYADNNTTNARQIRFKAPVAKGVYLLEVKSNNKKYNNKLIIK